MTELLRKINQSGLSPNEYFLAYALKEGLTIEHIDLEVVKGSLRAKGVLVGDEIADNHTLLKELDDKALLNNARRFQQVFPPIILPTGIPARGKGSQVALKLKTFLQSYDYDWDLIYRAAQQYVERYKRNKYLYMQNASNFVLDANGDSSLALECDTILYNEPEKDDII